MLKIGDRLDSYTLAAGEPWIMSVQMRSMIGNTVLNWSQRRLVLSFYDVDRTKLDQIDGVYTSDASGAYFAFIRDGRFSEGLYGKAVQVELAERLQDGRSVIATGALSVVPSSLGVTTYGTIIGRVDARFSLYFNTAELIALIEQELLPYAGASVPPPPVVQTPAAINSDGTPQVGEQLTGVDPVCQYATISRRRWLRGTTAVATTSLYTPDATGTLKWSVDALGDDGSTITSESSVTVAASSVTAPANLTAPVVTGTAQEGQVLTSSNGTWSNSPSSFAYQWFRNGTPIAGATNNTRTLSSDDVGLTLTCRVTASNAGGSTDASSAATAVVTAATGAVPANTAAPVVSGTGTVGQTLTTTNGTWTNSPTGYAYQWRRGGVDITGATGQSYVLGSADGGATITCRVLATNAGGTGSATSNQIVVAAAAATYAAENRPATFVVTTPIVRRGDSTEFGVATPSARGPFTPAGTMNTRATTTPAGGPFTAHFRDQAGSVTTATAAAVINAGQSGEPTTTIAQSVAWARTTWPAELGYFNSLSGGINDYNIASVPDAKVNWPAQVVTQFASMVADITAIGGEYNVILPIAENQVASGSRIAADYAYLRRQLRLTYKERFVDDSRLMRFKRRREGVIAGGFDELALNCGAVPYSYRGVVTPNDFPDGSDQSLTGRTGTAVPTTPESYADGEQYFRVGGAPSTTASYRKVTASGAPTWTPIDAKHPGRAGNAVRATIAQDYHRARDGSGPAFTSGAEVACPLAAAPGTVIGQVYFIGTADTYGLFNLDNTPCTEFTINSAGVITRTGAGSVVDGHVTLIIQTTKGAFSLHAPLDVYGVSSTNIPTVQNYTTGISIGSRAGTDIWPTVGKQFSLAWYGNVTNLASSPFLLKSDGIKAPTNAKIDCQLFSAGTARWNFVDDAATSTLHAVTGMNLVSGVNAWLLFAFDRSNDRRTGYKDNTAGAIATAQATTDLNFPNANFKLLHSDPEVELYTGAGKIVGGLGFMALFDQYVDWSDPAVRGLLFNSSGAPVARVPFSAVGGAVPRVEIGGSKGNKLLGSPDGIHRQSVTSLTYDARNRLS